MFFITFLIFFRTTAATAAGRVKIFSSSVTKSAARYPSFSSQGLTIQKYSPPPIRQNAAPYSRISPPQAPCDHQNSAPVAPSQNSRSSAGPSSGSLTRTRRMRSRSYPTPMAPPSSSA